MSTCPYPETLNHAKLRVAREILRDCGRSSFVAGGLLRDVYYEIPAKDIDIFYFGGTSHTLYAWEEPAVQLSWLDIIDIPEPVVPSFEEGESPLVGAVDRVHYKIVEGEFNGEEIGVDLIRINSREFNSIFKNAGESMDYTGRCLVSTFPIGASQVYGYYDKKKQELEFRVSPFFVKDYELIKYSCFNSGRKVDSLAGFWNQGEKPTPVLKYMKGSGITFHGKPLFPPFSKERATKNQEYRKRVGAKIVTHVKKERFL